MTHTSDCASLYLHLNQRIFRQMLYYARHAPTEVGGLAVTDAADPMRVVGVAVLDQVASALHTHLDDEAVAAHLERMAELGLPPGRAGRVWWHTHPGESAEPSPIDRVTFARAFGACDHAVMLIVAADGSTSATLHRRGLDMVEVPVVIEPDPAPLPLELDPRRPRWDADYAAHVRAEADPAGDFDDVDDRGGSLVESLDPAETLALLDLIEDERHTR